MKLLEDIHMNWAVASEMQKLQARVWHQAQANGMKVILLSSALRGEGKSTTVSHMGVMLALNPERRVLIADMDLRGPRQHHEFEVDLVPGIAEVIRGEASLETAIRGTEFKNLNLLVAGHSDNPAEVLNSPRLIHIFTELRAQHDIVIVDTPAIIPVADTSALLSIADGVILVVMSGKTPKASLTRARELCLGMNANILGLVVSNAMEAAPELYGSQYYSQYGSNPDRSKKSRGKATSGS